MKFTNILTLIGVLLAVAASGGTRAAAQPGDSVLLEMGSAFEKAQSKRLTELLPQARGHLLEPWAAYWELRARLGSAAPSEINAFLTRYQGTYHEDRLRNDWLLLLGQQRDWPRFSEVVAGYRMQDDRDVRCYTLVMQEMATGAAPADEVKALWYGQKSASDGCALAAATLYASQHLKPEDIWQKARMALELRQTAAARQAVAIVAPEALPDLAALGNNPARYLASQKPSARPATQELALLALIVLADNNPEAAATELAQRWSRHLTAAQRAWAWGAIGQQAAKSLSDDALRYFSHAKPEAMSDDHLAWRARAALRRHQWHDALAALQAMRPTMANDATWVYWRARALLQPGRSEAEQQQARQLLQGIAGLNGFYNLLALETLGQAIAPPAPPEPLSAEEKAAARANPGLQRALAAIALGLRSEGVREWNYSTNLHSSGGMSDRELLAAADLACAREVWDRCINTSERTKSAIDLTQRFPMPHKQAVLARSRDIGLDPAYVYGLIRQESRFIADARSGVGASGLMQVMPATAKWTAKKIGLNNFQPHQITERDTNIAIGTGYLKLVLDDFAGSMPMAAAAYNAGPGRPRSWRGNSGSPTVEAAIWAENIPFSETRDYVKKVLANTTIYAAMISGQTQSLKARLGHIGPRGAPLPDNKELP